MAIYIGKVHGCWFHTYSKKLRDKYFKKDYVCVFFIGTGKQGFGKLSGSIPLSLLDRGHIRARRGKYVWITPEWENKYIR